MSDNGSFPDLSDYEVGQALGAWVAWQQVADRTTAALRESADGIDGIVSTAATLAGTLADDGSHAGRMRDELLRAAASGGSAVAFMRDTADAIEASRRRMAEAAAAHDRCTDG